MLKIPAFAPASLPPVLDAQAASAAASEQTQDRAARTVTQFFRKSVAADVYHNMLVKGDAFRYLDYDPKNTPKHPESLLELKKLSQYNLDVIRDEIAPLTEVEKKLLANIVNSPWHFRHQTNGPVIGDNGNLNILSNHQLTKQGIKSSDQTLAEDRRILANDDFVFFAVEFTNRSKQGKLNSFTHGNCFYGYDAFVLEETDPRVRFGYFTLTDHLVSNLENDGHFELERNKWPLSLREMVDGIEENVYRQDLNDLQTDQSQMFSAKDMKLGLALHTINFLRNTESDTFRDWVFDRANENSIKLHRVLNLIFQPEFHLPRMWSTNQVNHIELGQAGVGDLLNARNFKKLDRQAISIEDCTKHLLLAIESRSDDICRYILNRPELKTIDYQAEAMGLHSSGDKSIAEALKKGEGPPSEGLLELLSQKGLIQ